jgi:hypothetical protein
MKRTVEVDRDLALIGASIKVKELLAEMERIYEMFPELRRGSNGRPATSKTTSSRKRRFSAAAKRRMSAGMRKYWARRRATSKAATARGTAQA